MPNMEIVVLEIRLVNGVTQTNIAYKLISIILQAFEQVIEPIFFFFSSPLTVTV